MSTPDLSIASSSPDLVVESLSCRRGGRLVFGGLDLRLDTGRTLLVTGANGSGKTSLLRTLALLLLPAAGRILWQSRDVLEGREAWQRLIGWLGHADAIKPELSVRENLDLGLRIGALPPFAQGGEANVAAAMELFGLTAYQDRACRHLSAGQRRRTALARLTASGARVWLMDEPTAALDATGVMALHAAIGAHMASGGLAVIATHGDVDLLDADRLDLDRLCAKNSAA